MSVGRCVSSMTLAMVKVLTLSVTPEQPLAAIVAAHAFDQFPDRLRLVAFGIEVGFDREPNATLGFIRPRRSMRCPQMLAEFRPAFAQQTFQRMLARRATECAYPSFFPLWTHKARSGS